MLEHQGRGIVGAAAGWGQIYTLTHYADLQYRHLGNLSPLRQRLAIDHTGALIAAKKNTLAARSKKCSDVEFDALQAIALAEFSYIGEVLRYARKPVIMRQPDKPLLILGYADNAFDRREAAVERVLKVGRSRLPVAQAPDMRSAPIAAYPQIPVGILEETPDQAPRRGTPALLMGFDPGKAIIGFIVEVQAVLGAYVDCSQGILEKRNNGIAAERMRVIGDMFEPCEGERVLVQNVQSARIGAHQELPRARAQNRGHPRRAQRGGIVPFIGKDPRWR